MKQGNPYYAVAALSHIYIGRGARKETLAKYKELTSRRFASRDEAEAAKPNDDNLTVVKCTPVYGII